MATVTIYDFVRMTCTPLQSNISHDPREKIAFYAYRGSNASQFPNLRAADTNKDGQLDFVVGVPNANYRKFLKLESNVFAPGSQNDLSLWGNPVGVARSALQLQCQTMKDERATNYWAFGGTAMVGIGAVALSAIIFKAPVGVAVLAVSPAAVAAGLLVLAGLLIIHGGFMYFGHELDMLEDRFYRSLNALFPLAAGG